MNKLNEMNIANLTDEEVEQLRQFEIKMNQGQKGEERYLLVLTK